MTIDFKKLKESRKSDFERIQRQIEENKGGAYEKDTRYYTGPQQDKAGNGYAIIRFLPAPPNEDVSFVRLWSHGFKGPTGKWYIENSLTTLKQKDPVGELNSVLYNSSEDENSPARKQASAQKRRLAYIANIYVVSDPANPENEGKVFLYRFGAKIWDKIQAAMYPQFPDQKPMNPFDLWEGSNFKLRVRIKDNFKNYDASEFDRPQQLLDSDEELERVYNQEYSLQDEVSPDKFKSYNELEKKLHEVLGTHGSAASGNHTKTAEELPQASYKPTPRQAAAQESPTAEAKAAPTTSGDPDLEFFENLRRS